MIPGLVVQIRKPEIDDVACISGWLASAAYQDNIGGQRDRPAQYYDGEARRMLQENANDNASNKYYLAIDRFSGLPIALAMLCKIDWKNRHGEYTFIIGAAGHRGKLAAGDLNVILYNYFFNGLNLNKVYGYVFSANAASLRLNMFGGMLDGVLRQHRRSAASVDDVHVLSILASEFAEFVAQHATTLLRKHIERGLLPCPR